MTANEDLLSTTAVVTPPAAAPVTPVVPAVAPAPDSNALQRGREIITALISVVILAAAMTAFGFTFFAGRVAFADDDVAKKQAYERQKDLLLIATGLLGTVTGYYLGRVPAELRASTAQTAADRAQADLASTTGLLNGAQQQVTEQVRQTDDVKRQAREAANAALKALNEHPSVAPPGARSLENRAPADATVQDACVRLERLLLL